MKYSFSFIAALSVSVFGIAHSQTIQRPPLKPLIPSLDSIDAYMDNKDHVFLYEKDGKLQTGIYERHPQPVIPGEPPPAGDPVNIRTQWRIFEGELFATTDFNGNPAVRSDRPGWANDPSTLLTDYKLTPDSSLSATALAFEIDGNRQNLFYWDGQSESPRFVQAPNGVRIQLWNQNLVYPQKTLVDGSGMDRQGPEISTVNTEGKFSGHHAHRDFSLAEIPQGQEAPKGIFLMKLGVRSSAAGVAPADPIFWIMNWGLPREKRAVVSEWVNRNLIPADQLAAIKATRIINPPDPNAVTCNCQGTICKKTANPKSEGGYTDATNAAEKPADSSPSK
ncbi:MAG: hypothetical protein KF712_14585 [Akkermansiaceae bacterium]|nr:hypothetical protein [Akkermansiaceae bacterium]